MNGVVSVLAICVLLRLRMRKSHLLDVGSVLSEGQHLLCFPDQDVDVVPERAMGLVVFLLVAEL